MKSLSQNNYGSAFNEETLLSELSAVEATGLFEDILRRDLSLRVKATGKSMAPFLNGGEFLTIKKAISSSLRVGDLIFFKTRHGFPLLHRIVRKRYKKNVYYFQTKGDALLYMDEPVSGPDILGKVCRIERNLSDGRTKQIDMESSIWKVINYLRAITSLGRSKIHTLLRCGLSSSFGHIIRKVFL